MTNYMVSLGMDNAPATKIRNTGQRNVTFPFDWSVTPIATALDHLRTGFGNWPFQIDGDNSHLVYMEPVLHKLVDDSIHDPAVSDDVVTPVFCTRTNTFFPHDFSVQSDYIAVKNKYIERLKRMYDLFQDTNNTFTFVAYNGILNPNSWTAQKFNELGFVWSNTGYDQWQEELASALTEGTLNGVLDGRYTTITNY